MHSISSQNTSNVQLFANRTTRHSFQNRYWKPFTSFQGVSKGDSGSTQEKVRLSIDWCAWIPQNHMQEGTDGALVFR